MPEKDYINAWTGAPAAYFSRDAGIWKWIPQVFEKDQFSLLQKGYSKMDIKVNSILEWGKFLKNPNIPQYVLEGEAFRNMGKLTFENIVKDGLVKRFPRGIRNPNPTHPHIDVITGDGLNLQCKFSYDGTIKSHVRPILHGGYAPANGVDGVVVNSELYDNFIHVKNSKFIEEASGVAVNPEDGTRLFDSGWNAKQVEKVYSKTEYQAIKYGQIPNLGTTLREFHGVSLKAAGIAALVSLTVSSINNYRKYKKGEIRGDDAVDSVFGDTLKASAAAYVSCFTTKSIMLAIGIPTAGLGLLVAIPIGMTVGAAAYKAISSLYDKMYMEVLGRRQIEEARKRNKRIGELFNVFDEVYSLKEEGLQLIEIAAGEFKPITKEEKKEIERGMKQAEAALHKQQKLLNNYK